MGSRTSSDPSSGPDGAHEKSDDARMRIYLVRHGDAVSQEDAGSDRDRWLSPRGREASRILGRLLREQRVAPDAIVCSPLPRAGQTAELVGTSLDYISPIT